MPHTVHLAAMKVCAIIIFFEIQMLTLSQLLNALGATKAVRDDMSNYQLDITSRVEDEQVEYMDGPEESDGMEYVLESIAKVMGVSLSDL